MENILLNYYVLHRRIIYKTRWRKNNLYEHRKYQNQGNSVIIVTVAENKKFGVATGGSDSNNVPEAIFIDKKQTKQLK